MGFDFNLVKKYR